MKNLTEKIILSPKNFKIGFELEFTSKTLNKKYCQPNDFFDTPTRYIKIPKRFKRVGVVGADGPLWELRTNPTCYTRSKVQLRKAFSLLKHLNASTHQKCGLHINVSCKNPKFHRNLDPMKLARLLEPSKITKLFGREKIDACKGPRNLKPFTIFEFYSRGFADWEKQSAINFLNYHPNPRKTSRIEFRFPGGKNYHKKEKLCIDTLENIVTSLSHSYSS